MYLSSIKVLLKFWSKIILFHTKGDSQKGEYDPHGENRFKPGICNRLDRGTEGLVIPAQNYAALRDMNEIIRTDLLKKEY